MCWNLHAATQARDDHACDRADHRQALAVPGKEHDLVERKLQDLEQPRHPVEVLHGVEANGEALQSKHKTARHLPSAIGACEP